MKGAERKLLALPLCSNRTTRSAVNRQDQSLLTAPQACHDHTHARLKIFTQCDLPQYSLRRKPNIGQIKTTNLAVCLVTLNQIVQGALEQTPGHNRALATRGFSQNESCCSDHQNKSLYQLGRIDSGARFLINPALPSVGEIMQPETAR